MYINDLGRNREFHYMGYTFTFTPINSNVRDSYAKTMIDISCDTSNYHECIMSTGYLQICGFTIITMWEYPRDFFLNELNSDVRKLKIHIDYD